MNKTKLCLNAVEVSEMTGLSLSMIRKLTHCGEIPHIKIGRRILYPVEVINEWLTESIIGNVTSKKGGDNNG